jgi:hypothetical protein
MWFESVASPSERVSAGTAQFWSALTATLRSEQFPPTPRVWQPSIHISSRTSFRTDIACDRAGMRELWTPDSGSYSSALVLFEQKGHVVMAKRMKQRLAEAGDR